MPGECNNWEEKSPEGTKRLLAVPIWRRTELIWKDTNEKRRIRLGSASRT
jgi:hypothetical protein